VNMDSKDAYAWGLANAVPNCENMANLMVTCEHGRVGVPLGLNSSNAARVRKLLVMSSYATQEIEEEEEDEEGEEEDDESEVIRKLRNAAGSAEDDTDAQVAVEEGLVSSDDEDFLDGVSLLQQPDDLNVDTVDAGESDPPRVLAGAGKKKRWGWAQAYRIIKAFFARRNREVSDKESAAKNSKEQSDKQENLNKKGEEERLKKNQAVIDFGDMIKAAKSGFECLWMGDAAKDMKNLDLTLDKPCQKVAKKKLDEIMNDAKVKDIIDRETMVSKFYEFVRNQFSRDEREFLKKFGVPKNMTEQCKTTKQTCEKFASIFELARKAFAVKEKEFRQQMAMAQTKYDGIKQRLLHLAKGYNIELVMHKNNKVMHNGMWQKCKQEWGSNKKLLADATKQWTRTEAQQSKIIRDKMKEYCGLQSTLNSVEEILKMAVTLPCKQAAWKSLGACSATCGGGVISFIRDTVQEPQNGGAPCGSSKKANACHLQACPVDCKLGEWAAWGKCKRTGSSGQRGRSRSYTKARHGGQKCTPSEYKENQKCTPPKPPLKFRWIGANNNLRRIRSVQTRNWGTFWQSKFMKQYGQSSRELKQLPSQLIDLRGRFDMSSKRLRCSRKKRHGFDRCHNRHQEKSGGNWRQRLRNRMFNRVVKIFRHVCKNRVRRLHAFCLSRCARPCGREGRAHYLGRPSGSSILYRMYFRSRVVPSRRFMNKCGAVKDGLSRISNVINISPMRHYKWMETFVVPNWKKCSGNAACQCPEGSYIGGMYTGTKNKLRDGWDDIKLFRCVQYTGGIDLASISCQWDVNTPKQVRMWSGYKQESKANTPGRRTSVWYALRGFRTKGSRCGASDHFMPRSCITEILWCSTPQWQQ